MWTKEPKDGAHWFCILGSRPDLVWISRGLVHDITRYSGTSSVESDVKHGGMFFPIEQPPPMPGWVEPTLEQWRNRALLAEGELGWKQVVTK